MACTAALRVQYQLYAHCHSHINNRKPVYHCLILCSISLSCGHNLRNRQNVVKCHGMLRNMHLIFSFRLKSELSHVVHFQAVDKALKDFHDIGEYYSFNSGRFGLVARDLLVGAGSLGAEGELQRLNRRRRRYLNWRHSSEFSYIMVSPSTIIRPARWSP